MLRAELALRGSSAFTSPVVLAIVVACSVYDESLLTGGSGGRGGMGGAMPAGGATGNDGGESNGESGKGGGTSGSAGSSGASGASGNGGVGGADAGGTTAAGGADGGEAGDATSGGTSGASAGGSSGGGSGGSAGTGVTAGAAGMCGVCGCDVPETDTDDDGVPDCNDACMGFDDAHCTALRSALRNRYSFDGTGTTITDSKGTAHGTAVNATLGGTGTLTLGGGNTSSPPYVDLPNGLISSLTNATFEVWVTWSHTASTGRNWQRIFDFGTSGTEDVQTTSGSATMTYLFLTPLAGSAPMGLRATYSTTGTTSETSVGTATALATGTVQHVVLVIDDAGDQMSLYLNGTFQQATNFQGALAQISDVNNWLGRSQWSGDYEFAGILDEFRIYEAALGAAQIATSRTAGPNPAFLQ